MTGHPLTQRLRVGLTAVLLCIAFYVLVPGFFAGIEKGLLGWKYRVRGEQMVDSSVAIVALTGDDIDALGGLPIKRSYYALAVSALADLGVRSIGLDLGLTDSGRAGPEYNDVLASVISGSGNVVMSGYFRSLSGPGTPDTHSTAPAFPEKFACEVSGEGPWPTGFHFVPPYQPFLDGAAGLGHTNLAGDLGLPACIRTRSGVMPLFSLEVLRRSAGGVSSLEAGDGVLALRGGESSYKIPYNEEGEVSLNFTGAAGSLTTIAFLDFLRAYDDLHSGGEGLVRVSNKQMAVRQLRDKIILLGVIAEGRSSFVDSPFGSQFPAIGLHALFIDNAIHGRFLTEVPQWAVALILLLIGVAGTLMIGPGGVVKGVAAVCVLLAAYAASSFFLFSGSALLLPVFVSWFTGVVLIVALLAYHHNTIGSRLARVSGEMETIGRTMRDREKRLADLRKEMELLRARGDDSESAKLLARIELYKAEIERLRLAGEDLQPFRPEGAESGAHSGPRPAGGAGNDGGGGRSSGHASYYGIVYDPSGAMAGVVEFIRKIAASDATVLITGESGSGKEIVARAIHESSGRSGKPFVAVNCGALTETLLESELFGHEKGAFTGALKEKPGRFEVARDGTIFLDEIGETSESFQVKLLRVLQDGTYERVGGTETLKSTARVITATNRDLKSAVERGSFRADLFYRLNVLVVALPPLRERPGDIVVLSRKFLGEQESGIAASEGVMKALAAHPWKGNVRELQSVITRGVLLARADGRALLRLKDLPEEVAGSLQPQGDIEALVLASLREKGFSRSAITETADEIGGFNRGTVAEYFRGHCFDTIIEAGYDVRKAAAIISGSEDGEVCDRVEKKLSEYLQNAREFVSASLSTEAVLERSRPKFKNLPRKYHASLEAVIRRAQEEAKGPG